MRKKLKAELKRLKGESAIIKADHMEEYSRSLDDWMPGMIIPGPPFTLQFLNVRINLIIEILGV